MENRDGSVVLRVIERYEDRKNTVFDVFGFLLARLPVVSDCSPQQTPRASSNSSSSSSSSGAASAASSGSAAGMAVSRVPSPPPPEVNTPVAENWCYTQVRLDSFSFFFFLSLSFSTDRSLHVLAPYSSSFLAFFNFILFLHPFFYANALCSNFLTFHCLFSPILPPFIRFFHSHAFLTFLITVLFGLLPFSL
jgi:hypothetical protein